MPQGRQPQPRDHSERTRVTADASSTACPSISNGDACWNEAVATWAATITQLRTRTVILGAALSNVKLPMEWQ